MVSVTDEMIGRVVRTVEYDTGDGGPTAIDAVQIRVHLCANSQYPVKEVNRAIAAALEPVISLNRRTAMFLLIERPAGDTSNDGSVEITRREEGFNRAGAVVHAAHVFTVHGWKGRTAQAVLAIVYVLAGFALVGNPAAGLATLTVVLVAFFFVDGLIEVYGGLKLRPEMNWQWMVASGAVSIVLAGLIWVTLPFAIVWVVGLLFGINLITTGASMIEIAFGGRNASTEERSPIAEPRGV